MTWVVKVGGSLGREPVLVDWLQLFATAQSVPIVIVPGGGAFADCVREQQACWRFDDEAAHAMALLAMAQFGLMLHAICPQLDVETSIAALKAKPGGTTTVWLPIELLHGADGIEASWDVTSDSLAAWLARALAADRLVLVKSCILPKDRAIEVLAVAGIVDRAFPALVQHAGFDVDLVEKHDLARIRALLAARR